MMQVTFQRNLIALEDLLLGTGTVEQTRGEEVVDVTKINGANFPYDDDFSMQEKMDALQGQIDSLPAVVDVDGNLLTGLIDTSASDISGTHSGRIWRRTISASEARIYYGSVMMFKYHPTDGNIITDATAYIAADVVVTNAFIAADAVVTAAFVAADVVVTNAYIAADVVAVAAAATAATTYANTGDATVTALVNHRVSVTQQANVAASSNVTKTITYTDGSWVKITVSSNFTLAFVWPSAEVCSMILEFVNGGAYTITWPAGVKFPAGVKPALTASGTDHVVLYHDGGNTTYAVLVAADVKIA